MANVRILPRHEFERIAAGEVVDRPASVVRELLDNGLDAGAKRIEIDLRRGGMAEIRVADDGEGMAEDDALLSLQRHATSKIRRLEDLAELHTLGFRGEALPSIAAVSHLDLLTAAAPGGRATQVRLGDDDQPYARPASRSRGTTVTVTDLFHNTPARRKFLKSPTAEFARISEVVIPAMLTRFEVGFALQHDGRQTVAAAPASGLRERIATLWGTGLAERLVPFAAGSGSAQVHGFVSGPDDTRASRRHWYLLVNGRPVKDRLLTHAVTHGLGESLPKGRYPSIVLLLDLSSDEVDVNVHPSKAEVRFADPNHIHALVASAVRRAALPATYVATGPMAVPGPVELPHRPSADPWPVRDQPPDATPGLFASPVVDNPPADVEPDRGPAGRPLAVLAQYRECFIVAHDAEALYLIDQHVAHERILYEKIRREHRTGGGDRQALLFPRTVELGAGQGTIVAEALPVVNALGFEVELFGEDVVMMRQVPAYLGEGPALTAFQDVLEIVCDTDERITAPAEAADRLQHRLAATVACHAAVKIHFSLTREKMEYLVTELFECDDPLTCPHGRRVVARWSHDDLLRTFGRS